MPSICRAVSVAGMKRIRRWLTPLIDVLSPGPNPWSAGLCVYRFCRRDYCADMAIQLMCDVYFCDASTEHSNCLVSQIFTKTWHVYNHSLLKLNLFFFFFYRQATPINVFDCLHSPCIPCAQGNEVCKGRGYLGESEFDMAIFLP